MRLARTFATIGMLAAFTAVLPASAQQARAQIDRTRLTQLYDAYVRSNLNDTFVEQRITEERLRIRNMIEREIRSLVSETTVSESAESTDLPRALDRQQALVTLLEERLRESKVDMEILTAEEKTYLSPQTATGALPFRLTQSYPDLLSRKAVLSEYVTVIESTLPTQRDRLQKLAGQARISRVAAMLTALKYLGIIVLVILLERFIRKTFIHAVREQKRRYFITKIFATSVYALLTLWLITTLLAERPGLLSSVAIIGAGLAVALQDVVKDIVGWIVIINTRPFSPGDRISLGMYTGDVLDVGMFRTTLMEVGMPVRDSNVNLQAYTGNILYVPNARLLTDPLLNFNRTSDFIKAEIDLTITFGSDREKAEKILETVLREQTEEYTEQERMQHRQRTSYYYMALIPTGPMVYTTIAQNGVQFILRFDVPIGKRRFVISEVSKDILRRFEREPDITLAYNTTRVYSTPVEGGLE